MIQNQLRSLWTDNRIVGWSVFPVETIAHSTFFNRIVYNWPGSSGAAVGVKQMYSSWKQSNNDVAGSDKQWPVWINNQLSDTVMLHMMLVACVKCICRGSEHRLEHYEQRDQQQQKKSPPKNTLEVLSCDWLSPEEDWQLHKLSSDLFCKLWTANTCSEYVLTEMFITISAAQEKVNQKWFQLTFEKADEQHIQKTVTHTSQTARDGKWSAALVLTVVCMISSPMIKD